MGAAAVEECIGGVMDMGLCAMVTTAPLESDPRNLKSSLTMP